MHRGIHASVVLTPLVIGLGFLLFAIFTEYWTSLDFSQVKKYERTNASDQLIRRRNNLYQLRRHRIEFPKYTSLFGECNEYKPIELIEPVPTTTTNSAKVTQTTSANLKTDSIEANQNSESMLQQSNNDVVCMTREECQSQLPQSNQEELSCFCCSKPTHQKQNTKETNDDEEEEGYLKRPSLQQCCYPNSKVCDIYHDCMDKSSDELADCPSRKLYFATQSHDLKHNCLRNQYNIWQFLVNTCDKPQEVLKMFKSNNYSVKIFLMRLLTLFGLTSCVLFTLLCLITMLFVVCCRNLSDQKNNRVQHHSSASFADRLNRNETLNCADNCAVVEDLDDDYDESTSKLKNCCRCNCLLCPFAFYSFFALFAFVSFTFALCTYLVSLSYVKNSYLIYDTDYVPAYITSAYQHNPWLFNVQQFGVSFYSLIVSYVMYLLVLILSSCITCRMEISPAWRGRYADSYEVLQMHPDAMVTPPLTHAQVTFDKNSATKKESKKEKKKSPHLAEEERMSINMSDVQLATATGTRSKNGNQYS